MISPLRCPHDFKSKSVLKEIIDKGSVVGTYLFFDGNIELGIASPDRLVIAHTNNYTISEFWACARFDPGRLAKIIEHLSKIEESKILYTMQESWSTYKDPFVRSAMFFLLNRCSTRGMISSGDVDLNHYNPLSLSRLHKLKNLKHFHLIRTQDENFLKGTKNTLPDNNLDYLLIPAGRFNYNLFEDGKAVSDEDTRVGHRDVEVFFKKQEKKCMIVYKKHETLFGIYEGQNIIMVDKRGNRTKNKELCEDLIIANF
jgi:hypothetical protein